MDLERFPIGALHFDDVSLVEEVLYPCPSNATIARIMLQNNGVAVTGGTNVLTPRKRVSQVVTPFSQTLTMTAAAEALSVLSVIGTDPVNRFARGELFSIASDGGGSSVNQADMVVVMKSEDSSGPNGDFHLAAYFDDVGAAESTFIPIPVACRIRSLLAVQNQNISFGTYSILTLRKDGPSPTVGLNFGPTGIAFTGQPGTPASHDFPVYELGPEYFYADPANIFAPGDRLKLSSGGAAGNSEALVIVTFERLTNEVGLDRYWLTCQFDNIASGEIGYVPVPFAGYLESIRCLSYSAGATPTVTVRAAGTAGGDRALGSFAISGSAEGSVLFTPAYKHQQSQSDVAMFLNPANADRIELDVASGGTGELVMLCQFRRGGQ